jgi:hypothetical protein
MFTARFPVVFTAGTYFLSVTLALLLVLAKIHSLKITGGGGSARGGLAPTALAFLQLLHIFICSGHALLISPRERIIHPYVFRVPWAGAVIINSVVIITYDGFPVACMNAREDGTYFSSASDVRVTLLYGGPSASNYILSQTSTMNYYYVQDV